MATHENYCVTLFQHFLILWLMLVFALFLAVWFISVGIETIEILNTVTISLVIPGFWANPNPPTPPSTTKWTATECMLRWIFKMLTFEQFFPTYTCDTDGERWQHMKMQCIVKDDNLTHLYTVQHFKKWAWMKLALSTAIPKSTKSAIH